MEAGATTHLKRVNADRNKILYADEDDNSNNPRPTKRSYRSILEEIAVSSGGELSSSCHRLLKTLRKTGKSMKRIEELYRRKMYEDANINEGENEEHLQDFLVVPPQGLSEADASEEEDNNAESLQDIPVSLQGPSETDASEDEDNNAESLQHIPISLQEPSEADASEDEDNHAEFPQDIPVSPRCSEVEEINAEFFQKIPLPSENSREAYRNKYKTIVYSPVFPLLQGSKDSIKRLEPFRVLMDVCNFLPNEVDVKIREKTLVIHGKHGKVTEPHGEVSREFTRQIEIPEDVDIETFRALRDCYGVLTVEASRKPMNSKEGTLDLLAYEGTDNQQVLPSLKNFGSEEFEKLLRSYAKDGEEMAQFAINLSKQQQSCYIPMDEVI